MCRVQPAQLYLEALNLDLQSPTPIPCVLWRLPSLSLWRWGETVMGPKVLGWELADVALAVLLPSVHWSDPRQIIWLSRTSVLSLENKGVELDESKCPASSKALLTCLFWAQNFCNLVLNIHYLIQHHYFHTYLFLSYFSKICEFLVGRVSLDSQLKQWFLMFRVPLSTDNLVSDIFPPCLELYCHHGHNQVKHSGENRKEGNQLLFLKVFFVLCVNVNKSSK